MKNLDNSLIKYIQKNNYTIDTFKTFLHSNCSNEKDVINSIFKIIFNIKNIYNEKNLIVNSVTLLSFICKNSNFNKEDVLKFQKNVKELRHLLLKNLLNKENHELRIASNKLDELAFIKSIDEKKLCDIIIKLIGSNTDINIIKKFLTLNKLVIIYNDNYIFNYIFSKTVEAYKNNDYLITYYITLLKLFYPSNINNKKYLKVIDALGINMTTNEIRNIILGDKRSLKTNEIIKKYDKETYETEGNIIIIQNNNINNSNSFTIDYPATTLRDDSVSIKKDGNKYIIGIHITDVAKCISYDSMIDINARNISKNSYLNGKKIEIFQNNISSQLSLEKNTAKPSISIYIITNEYGNIIDYNISDELIIPKENYSYVEIDMILRNKLKSELNYEINKIYEIAQYIKKQNTDREEYWKLKENGYNKHDYSTCGHTIVSEFSILYNTLISQIAKDNNIPYIYRAQDKSYFPSLISEMDIKLDNFSFQTIKDIYLCGYLSEIPKPHSGLCIDCYSHSTSPLRRYSDLYNQYLLHKYLFKDIDFDDSNYLQIIKYLNEREFETKLFEEEYNRAYSLEKKRVK